MLHSKYLLFIAVQFFFMIRYGHMRRILDKILSERPNNPLENFEKFSHLVKRTYVNEEVHFEQVFVDDINRNACKNNLQMYKVVIYQLISN